MERDIMADLQNIRSYRQEIEALQNRLERLRSAATGSRQPLRHGSRGTAEQDPIAGLLVQMQYVQERLLQRIVEAEMRTLEVEQLVDALPGPQRQVLRLRYFEGYGWREIAQTMHYSERRCLQLHEVAGNALCALPITTKW